MTKMCPCGQALHFASPVTQRQVQRMVDDLGEFVPVIIPAGAWMVSRYYIALHGIVATELPALARALGFARALQCPGCDRHLAEDDLKGQMSHLSAAHPDIVAARRAESARWDGWENDG